MKMYLRKAMQNVATYVELALSAFLTIVIVVLIVKLIGESFFSSEWRGTGVKLLSGISDDPCDWN